LTKKNAENSPKPGKDVPASLPTEVWQNCHDSIQEVETEEDKRLQENAKQAARHPKEGGV
jgi:hypothetical protein